MVDVFLVFPSRPLFTFVLLGLEPRPWHMLGKCFTTKIIGRELMTVAFLLEELLLVNYSTLKKASLSFSALWRVG
jgi:hypothetical protein